MNRDYFRTHRAYIHLTRLILLIITIIYINILSCGQNVFGAHANRNSTSDSEFIHIVMWVALAIDSYVFLCRVFEIDDGTTNTSLLIDCAFSLIYFAAFVILLVSWIKCSSSETKYFCYDLSTCWIYLFPTLTSILLSILFVYHHIRQCQEEFYRIY